VALHRAYRPGNGANAVSGDDLAEHGLIERMHGGSLNRLDGWEPPALKSGAVVNRCATVAGGELRLPVNVEVT
jgi:hypothetical protein